MKVLSVRHRRIVNLYLASPGVILLKILSAFHLVMVTYSSTMVAASPITNIVWVNIFQ